MVAVARDGKLLGLLGIADVVKPDAEGAVARLRSAGITPIMVTGDNQRTAMAAATEVGIDLIHASVLPEAKAAIVRDLQAQGHRVLMVGEGINDAPALTQADIGVAMGAGTDIAIESADVVLVGNRLSAVADARDIGTNSFRKTKQNLTIALTFNGLGVPLAMTGLVGPVWAMVTMASSVTIVLANSFGARLGRGPVFDIGRFLGRSGLSTLAKLRPADLRRWARSYRPGLPRRRHLRTGGRCGWWSSERPWWGEDRRPVRGGSPPSRALATTRSRRSCHRSYRSKRAWAQPSGATIWTG
jgi:soluble P-type ATPase